jgi:hypothetical protein
MRRDVANLDADIAVDAGDAIKGRNGGKEHW